MQKQDFFWSQLDDKLREHQEYILTTAQRQIIVEEEKKAYEINLDSIKTIIIEFEKGLKERGFWTVFEITEEAFMFKFNKIGYYGPGGVSPQYHIGGPLVLGVLKPKGNAYSFYCNNKLEQNVQIGCNYDKEIFTEFIKKIILEFISNENLIISKEQYDYLRNFNTGNRVL
ncbi:hypothetical protein CMU84_17745 [Elizabethkingia anophelis]|nr:hypothetical protein [Elizabethkingia anophelis]MDV3710158.1 hypothetical protein [Elizabethkingia anophelis]MDV3733625.1 hypothetical protein [Elizabethkingia anophelis]